MEINSISLVFSEVLSSIIVVPVFKIPSPTRMMLVTMIAMAIVFMVPPMVDGVVIHPIPSEDP